MDNPEPNQPQNNNVPIEAPTAPQTETVVSKTPAFKKFKENIGPLMKDVLARVMGNKKMFYLLSGILGLLILIIIVGVIYKISGSFTSKVKVTPTPTATGQNINTVNQENLSPLDKMENDLNGVKIKIDNLDVKQLPLTPPVINYKIKF
ncbi:MAG: hypothetical protein AAB622_03100 [Patescibacteria group bacterium]